MSDRKYRQSGYQDTGRSEPPSARGPQPPRPKPDGPRGRGLGAPSAEVFRCGACGKQVPLAGGAVAFDAVCPQCRADLHTCNSCRHFDTGTRFECRQDIPERVAKKRDRNACALFAPKLTIEFAADATRSGGTDRSNRPGNDARAAFDALFKI